MILTGAGSKSRGFTLVEILLVLGIIAAAMAIAMTRVNRRDTNIKSVVRKMSTTVREIRNKAKLYNSTYRLVVNFDANPPTYSVDKATGKVARLSKEEREELDRLDKADKPPELFQKDPSFGKKDTRLPSGLFFKSLETVYMEEPITSGTGYIYFSPEGFVENSAIQITDRKDLTWTLVFNPLTGQASIIQTAKSLKDLKQ